VFLVRAAAFAALICEPGSQPLVAPAGSSRPPFAGGFVLPGHTLTHEAKCLGSVTCSCQRRSQRSAPRLSAVGRRGSSSAAHAVWRKGGSAPRSRPRVGRSTPPGSRRAQGSARRSARALSRSAPRAPGATSGIFLRRRPWARSASTTGSVVPATSASSISRPDLPSTPEATQPSLIPVSSRILCSRAASRERSLICVLRYRVRFAQRPDRLGRHEARLRQPGLQQLAEPLGVLDVGLAPGTAFTCRALTSVSLKWSSRIAHTGFQCTPVASIATCLTRARALDRAVLAERDLQYAVALVFLEPGGFGGVGVPSGAAVHRHP